MGMKLSQMVLDLRDAAAKRDASSAIVIAELVVGRWLKGLGFAEAVEDRARLRPGHSCGEGQVKEAHR